MKSLALAALLVSSPALAIAPQKVHVQRSSRAYKGDALFKIEGYPGKVQAMNEQVYDTLEPLAGENYECDAKLGNVFGDPQTVQVFSLQNCTEIPR